MTVRALLRGTFDVGCLLAAELIEYGSRWTVARLTGERVSDAEPAAEEETDTIQEVTDADMAELRSKRSSMVAPPRSRPVEEDPPLEPPVGSIQWREQQRARASRSG